jgi:hypothetical protein
MTRRLVSFTLVGCNKNIRHIIIDCSFRYSHFDVIRILFDDGFSYVREVVCRSTALPVGPSSISTCVARSSQACARLLALRPIFWRIEEDRAIDDRKPNVTLENT